MNDNDLLNTIVVTVDWMQNNVGECRKSQLRQYTRAYNTSTRSHTQTYQSGVPNLQSWVALQIVVVVPFEK